MGQDTRHRKGNPKLPKIIILSWENIMRSASSSGEQSVIYSGISLAGDLRIVVF